MSFNMNWVQKWHEEPQHHDQIATVEIDGQRFNLTARKVGGTEAWLATVDHGFDHRLAESHYVSSVEAQEAALELAQRWLREQRDRRQA